MRRRIVGVAALALVLVAAPARAEDEGRRSVGFSGTRGLTGMREMVDARVPELLNVRGMLRFEHESLNLESNAFAHSVDTYAAEGIGGVSALGMLDAGIRYPLEIRVNKDDVRGVSSHQVTIEGVGDPELSGKVAFKLGPVSLGPYGTAHFNIGHKSLEHTNKWDLGACGTLAILNDHVAVHGNITWVRTFVHFGPGKFAFGYRLGGSVVPWADETLVLRLYLYLDGLEYGGTPGSDVKVAVGAQALLMKILTVEIGSFVKVEDGDLPTQIRNVGTYGINFSAGVSFMF